MSALKGEVAFEIGEDRYRLVFTIDALIELEEHFGRTVEEIGKMLEESMKMKDLKRLFAAGLSEYHGDLDSKGVNRVFSGVGLMEATSLIVRAFVAAFGVGGVADMPAGPPAESEAAVGSGATA